MNFFLVDYVNLNIVSHKNRIVKLAFGGFSFSLSSTTCFKSMGYKAFRVTLNLDMQYVIVKKNINTINIIDYFFNEMTIKKMPLSSVIS